MGNDKKIRVGITHGDINGIGYEIILKTLSEPTICELCTPVLYGSSRIATFYRKMIDLENVPFNVINDANDIKSGYNNLIEVLATAGDNHLGGDDFDAFDGGSTT